MNSRITVLLLLFGALFLFHNGNFDAILGINSNKSFEDKFDTFQANLTPTPEPLIACVIGKFSLDLQENRCDTLRDTVNGERAEDSATVQELIKNLNMLIGLRDEDLDFLKTKANEMNNRIAEQKKSGTYTYEQWSADLNGVNIIVNNVKSTLDAKYRLEDERDHYIDYNFEILYGGIGSGACSDHEGVDCSTPRGHVGQVICADGWNESQVYYFNVKECVEYTESTLSQ